MKKIVLALTIFLASTMPVFAMGGLGGSKPGTCDLKSWGCNAFPSCYYSPKENRFYNFPIGSVERATSEASYKACARIFVTECMTSGTPTCDAKKYFPSLYA